MSASNNKDRPIQLYTDEDLAKAAKVSTRTLRRLRKSGKLSFVRLGNAIRYTPECYQKCIEANTRNAA